MFEANEIQVGMTVTAEIWQQGIKTGTVTEVCEVNLRWRVYFTDENDQAHWCYIQQVQEVNGKKKVA